MLCAALCNKHMFIKRVCLFPAAAPPVSEDATKVMTEHLLIMLGKFVQKTNKQKNLPKKQNLM